MRVTVGYRPREMSLHSIQLVGASFNPAEIRGYQKAGFVEEGRHRQALLHDRRWYDEVLVSILDHGLLRLLWPGDRWAARGRQERRSRPVGVPGGDVQLMTD